MLKPLTLLLLLFSLFQFAAAKDLEFEKIHFGRNDTEISGLYHDGTNLLFVADKLSNRYIYQAVFQDKRFYTKEHTNLKVLKGHDKYFKNMILNRNKPHKLSSPFDFEGITYCKNNFYIVNEQARDVLRISKNKLRKLNIDFNPIFKKLGVELKDISVNAGFEGITADCKNKKLYIAQERGPRAIIEVDLKTKKAIAIFQTPSFAVKKKGKNKISDDYADIYFESDHLYLLERNSHILSKYSLKLKKIVDKYSFKKLKDYNMDQIYNTGEPYGLAEGLAMTKDTIYIALDNNKSPLTKKLQKKLSIKSNTASILIFKRPKGF